METLTSTASSSVTEEQELVALAQRRKDDPAGKDSLARLIERYRPPLTAIASRCAWDRDSRDDVLQEGVIGLIRAVDGYDPAKGPFAPWALMWIKGRCIRGGRASGALRNTARLNGDGGLDQERIARDEPALEDIVTDVVERAEMTRLLAEAVSSLPDVLQAALSPGGSDRQARRSAEAMLRHPCLRSVLVGGHGEDARGASANTQQFGQGLEKPPSEAEEIANLSAMCPMPDPRGDWLLRAACRGVKPQVFFPSPQSDRTEPISICRGCPVRIECLRDAIALPDRGGIRAGTTERKRRALKSPHGVSEPSAP